MSSDIKYKQIYICDLCGSKKYIHFLNAEDRNYKTGKFKYVSCTNCGLVWLNPRPIDMSIYYPKIYKAHAPLNSLSYFQKIIRNEINSHILFAKLLIKDQLHFDKKKGKLLDVGTGNGDYLQILNSWGWSTYGVETDKRAVKIANNNGIDNVKLGSLFSAKFKKNQFDVVRFSHVLEHVPSPNKEIKETKRILKNKGMVLILVPNINSISFKIFKSYWYPLDAPRHLFQFSPETLSNLLKKHGFKNIKIKYNQSPYILIRSVLFVLGFSKVEKRVAALVYPLGLILNILNILKVSDTIEITGINYEK